MPTLGRKPGSKDIGVGHMEPGRARGTIAGRVSAQGWVYQFGAHVGVQPGQPSGHTATYYQALYQASGGAITTLVGQSVAGTTSRVMDWAGNGSNQTLKPTAPIRVWPGIDYAIPIRVASGNFAHGQDHSGTRMHDRTGAGSSFPSPFNASHVRPEGAMSSWVEIQNNRAPNKPSSLSPANNALVVSTPTLGASFTDPDETLPGFSVGQADKVYRYRFEVWNSGKTSRLRDSGVVNAVSAQQTARRVTWTPSALPAGRYVARVTVWDMFNVPSATAEWTFTINAGGAIESPDVAQGSYASGWADEGQRILHHTAVGTAVSGTWTHSSNLPSDRIQFELRTGSNTVIATGPELSIAASAGSMVQRTLSVAGLPALTPGQTYRVAMRGRDNVGLWTDWSVSEPFLVNAPPNAPSNLDPGPGAVRSERPLLRAIMSDPNDPTESLGTGFQVREQGDTGDGIYIPQERRAFVNGWHTAQPTEAEMPTHGIYEWRCRAGDPWGATGPWSAWQTLTYATPPVVTITSHSDNDTITTGTPTFVWTVDKAQSSWAYVIRDRLTGFPAHEEGPVSSTSDREVTVPVGVLHNATAYRLELTITSTEGLVGMATLDFEIQYPQPAALAWVTVEPTPGPFEQSMGQHEWSRLAVSWPAVSEAEVDDERFAGYLVWRRSLMTGETVLMKTYAGRSETVFIDRTPRHAETYEYLVSYLVRENNLDLIESAPVSATGAVYLTQTVLCTLDDDDLGVPLRYWEARDADWMLDRETVPSWGTKPIGFAGPADSDEIVGHWQVMDEPQHGFTARDLIEATRRIAGVRQDGGGAWFYPRTVCYRDPRGRIGFMQIMNGGDIDRHFTALGEITLVLAEVDVDQGESIEGGSM